MLESCRGTFMRPIHRRDFLKSAAALSAAGAGYWIAGRQSMADQIASTSPSERIAFAAIGIGGKGDGDAEQVGKHGDLIAVCDVDETRLTKKQAKYPNIRVYTDFRKMFDELGKQIDAVTVSTPDHTHAVASMMAMKLGKHVYTQKPMTHSVYEARLMRETAKKMKVATQMGNQGTANDMLRTGVEVIQSGGLGP